ncbi:MAG: hypothetical protein ACKOYC_07190 [Bacteroidota bacterium]
MIRVLPIFLLFVLGCNRTVDIREVKLTTANGDIANMDSILHSRNHTTFLFFSPECPVCLISIDELKRINATHQSLVYVYPGSYYDARRILDFHKEYKIDALALMDTANVLVNILGAQVTPHAIVTDKDGNKLYTGAIDDRSTDFGTKKVVVTRRYLSEALENLASGKPVSIDSTEAFGCYIE